MRVCSVRAEENKSTWSDSQMAVWDVIDEEGRILENMTRFRSDKELIITLQVRTLKCDHSICLWEYLEVSWNKCPECRVVISSVQPLTSADEKVCDVTIACQKLSQSCESNNIIVLFEHYDLHPLTKKSGACFEAKRGEPSGFQDLKPRILPYSRPHTYRDTFIAQFMGFENQTTHR
ncbi:hypothetical protein Aduo_019366 [Ancylostoma duodenale]